MVVAVVAIVLGLPQMQAAIQHFTRQAKGPIHVTRVVQAAIASSIGDSVTYLTHINVAVAASSSLVAAAASCPLAPAKRIVANECEAQSNSSPTSVSSR